MATPSIASTSASALPLSGSGSTSNGRPTYGSRPYSSSGLSYGHTTPGNRQRPATAGESAHRGNLRSVRPPTGSSTTSSNAASLHPPGSAGNSSLYSAHSSATSSASKPGRPSKHDLTNNFEYQLVVRQQPKQARICSTSDKQPKGPVDPPPVVKLQISRSSSASSDRPPSGGETSASAAASNPSTTNLTSASLIQSPYLFCFAALCKAEDDEEIYLLGDGKTRCVTGQTCSSLYHLKDPQDGSAEGFFVFPDIGVLIEGRFRLKISLYEMVDATVHHCKTIYTEAFDVYNNKRYPGPEDSTELSRSFANQGLKMRIKGAGPARSANRSMEGTAAPELLKPPSIYDEIKPASKRHLSPDSHTPSSSEKRPKKRNLGLGMSTSSSGGKAGQRPGSSHQYPPMASTSRHVPQEYYQPYPPYDAVARQHASYPASAPGPPPQHPVEHGGYGYPPRYQMPYHSQQQQPHPSVYPPQSQSFARRPTTAPSASYSRRAEQYGDSANLRQSEHEERAQWSQQHHAASQQRRPSTSTEAHREQEREEMPPPRTVMSRSYSEQHTGEHAHSLYQPPYPASHSDAPAGRSSYSHFAKPTLPSMPGGTAGGPSYAAAHGKYDRPPGSSGGESAGRTRLPPLSELIPREDHAHAQDPYRTSRSSYGGPQPGSMSRGSSGFGLSALLNPTTPIEEEDEEQPHLQYQQQLPRRDYHGGEQQRNDSDHELESEEMSERSSTFDEDARYYTNRQRHLEQRRASLQEEALEQPKAAEESNSRKGSDDRGGAEQPQDAVAPPMEES